MLVVERISIVGALSRCCADASSSKGCVADAAGTAVISSTLKCPRRHARRYFTDYRCATGVAANLQRRAFCLGQRIVEILLPQLRQMVPRSGVVFQQEAWKAFQIFYARNCRGTLREAVQRKIDCQCQPQPLRSACPLTDKNTSCWSCSFVFDARLPPKPHSQRSRPEPALQIARQS